MNQLFDLRRFGLLVQLHLSEHLKTYLMGIAVLFGIWIVMLAPSTARTAHFNESVYRLHGILFSFLFGGAGAWFASEAFRVVGTPVRGIPHLMLPASQLEKYLLGLLMLLLFVPVFLGVFYTVEAVCFAIINSRLPVAEPRYQLLNLAGDAIPFDLRYLSWAAPSLFLLGSIYFAKVPFVKTCIVAFLIYFFFLFLNELLILQVFPVREHYGNTPFAEVFFLQSGRRYDLELTGLPRQVIYSVLLLMVPALWFTAYIRFKEKEL
ncbi:hypothetical protein GCM10023189_34290 [Nibrella saemangeumensis]|uniref:ABC-2 type transport system permease protein n=1 Tax=Nibrella saemangeumensis TaxID=1084526 RepID=A0ABP8N201_9BACT